MKVPKASNSSNTTFRLSNVIRIRIQNIHMYVQVAHCAVSTYYDQMAVGNPK